MRTKSCTVLVLLISLAFSGAASASDGLTLPLHQADSGNYYLPARLNGAVETDLLFDTGSGYVTLGRATFDRLKGDVGTVFARSIHGAMANGKVLEVKVYRIRELSLGEHCVLRDIEVAVLPNATRDILGLNALRRLQPFTLQMEPPLISGAHC